MKWLKDMIYVFWILVFYILKHESVSLCEMPINNYSIHDLHWMSCEIIGDRDPNSHHWNRVGFGAICLWPVWVMILLLFNLHLQGRYCKPNDLWYATCDWIIHA